MGKKNPGKSRKVKWFKVKFHATYIPEPFLLVKPNKQPKFSWAYTGYNKTLIPFLVSLKPTSSDSFSDFDFFLFRNVLSLNSFHAQKKASEEVAFGLSEVAR